MEAQHRTPARLVALIALVVAAVALVVVISSASGGSGGSANSAERSAEKARDLGSTTSDTTESRTRKRNKDKLPQDVYVVKSGDTLGGIAEKTGVPVERLEELNPGLDQFQLVAGQRIKLR
jgi:LysM repeat protein